LQITQDELFHLIKFWIYLFEVMEILWKFNSPPPIFLRNWCMGLSSSHDWGFLWNL